MKHYRSFVLAICVPVLIGGCGYLKQSRDSFEFQAKPEMVRAQTLNPEAGKNRKVVAGLDGPAAAAVSNSYAKSFERQQTGRATEAFGGMTALSN